MFAIIFCFLILFVVTLGCIGLGTKYFDGKRKKQVTAMLQTVSGEPVVKVTNLLIEPADQQGTRMERFLTRFNFARTLKDHLQQAGLDWSADRFFLTMASMAVAGVLFGMRFPILVNEPITCTAAAFVFGMAPYLFVRRKRTKRLAAFEAQFPEALEFLARSMRAGHAFTISLEMLGDELGEPLAQEFRTLFNEQNLGAPIGVALENLAARVPLLDVRFFSSSVMLQKQTGGNLSEILSRLSEVIRERFRLKGQVKAASAHGRLTATILMIMPIVTMMCLMAISPGYLEGMAKDSDGKWLIAGAIVAQILGNFFIRRIINIKV